MQIYGLVTNHTWLDQALNQASVDPHDPSLIDYNYISQMYTNSWVSQEFIPNVLHISSGSSAGTPLADVIYSLCMSRVIVLLRKSLERDNLSSSVKIGGNVGFG